MLQDAKDIEDKIFTNNLYSDMAKLNVRGRFGVQ